MSDGTWLYISMSSALSRSPGVPGVCCELEGLGLSRNMRDNFPLLLTDMAFWKPSTCRHRQSVRSQPTVSVVCIVDESW